ncbi:MAG: hypothetical protein KKI08_19320 [Armatimonadetes bacterium]|nr:hypothetical protein [Armatimonadota bacterium]
MIVFISDLHIGATVPLSADHQQLRAQVWQQAQQRVKSLSQPGDRELEPLKLQLTAGAVRGFYADLARLAQGANAEKVTIVLLGDIFDLIQTRLWQEKSSGQDEAWVHGEPDEQQVLAALTEIAEGDELNREFFRELSRREAVMWEDAAGNVRRADIERVYIPGNHDRLCNLHGSVREKVRDILGIPYGTPEEAKAEFGWELSEDLQREYGVLARHGHVFDAHNYAGSKRRDAKDHERAPIGDLLTTQIASKLYRRMARALEDQPHLRSTEDYAQVVRALEAMFAAPGAMGPVGFLWKRLRGKWSERAIIWAVLATVARLTVHFGHRCWARPPWFGRSWWDNAQWGLRAPAGLIVAIVAVAGVLGSILVLLNGCLRWLVVAVHELPLPAHLAVWLAVLALAILAVRRPLRRYPLPTLGGAVVALLGGLLAVVFLRWPGPALGPLYLWAWAVIVVLVLAACLWVPLACVPDPNIALLRGAIREARPRRDWLRCVVYGHTHNPVQELLTVGDNGAPIYYLNAGTWHQKLDPAADGSDFVSHKNMTYVVVYKDSEATADDHGTKQYFETWTGTLHDGDCFRPGDDAEAAKLLRERAEMERLYLAWGDEHGPARGHN